MKRRRVIWSRDAYDDLKAAVGYIARDNPSAARRVNAAIRKAGAKLGSAATGRPGRVFGTYEKVVARLPYILVYELAAVRNGLEEEIVILYVVHGARDWPGEGNAPTG